MAYTTQGKIEDYLGRSLTADEIAFLPTLIGLATNFINRYTATKFEADSTASNRYYDATHVYEVPIDDCVEITEIALLATFDDNDDGDLVDDDDYISYPLNTTYKNSIRFGSKISGHKRVRVKAKWGQTTTVPSDIEFACTAMCSDYFQNPQNLKQESIEGYSRTWFSGNETGTESVDSLPSRVRLVLESRKHVLL